jgi:hypothetical protein
VWGGDEPFADPAPAAPLDPPESSYEGPAALADDYDYDRADPGQPGPAGADAAPGDDAPTAGARAARGDDAPTAGARAARGGVGRGAPALAPRGLQDDGRRTVRIGGRPGEFAPRTTRRRPPRTIDERIGSRPDRVAAWAFALGILLILVALLV